MATLLLIGLLGALLVTLGHKAPVQPPARGIVEHLVLGLHELQRLSGRPRRLWDHRVAELQRRPRASGSRAPTRSASTRASSSRSRHKPQ